MDFRSVLDIGADGSHAEVFKSHAKTVTTISLSGTPDYFCRYEDLTLPQDYDCLWASHVLEHSLSPHLFLKKCFNDLKNNGILAITVPPLKHEIVGGHLSLWNAGLLIYHLILAGFDCKHAAIKTYGYNISVVLRKTPVHLPELKMDFGDIETLRPYFPFSVVNGFEGQIQEINW